ncbi:hypothetical protein PoB_006158900 [Plakobranchus ocellatus]|uniref:Uncharacterized protein n=1 Tax=Plakobranchus ocellatus TaxID=259542 RepID=A0AAV4CT89_9GAST|nr:hypothetical protein PoB_006158900 [Plakobranchus ocellatus]
MPKSRNEKKERNPSGKAIEGSDQDCRLSGNTGMQITRRDSRIGQQTCANGMLRKVSSMIVIDQRVLRRGNNWQRFVFGQQVGGADARIFLELAGS